MSPTVLAEKIAALPATEQDKVEAFVDGLMAAEKPETISPRESFDQARRILEGLHGTVDISSSVRELRDSE